jgi:hypothetical protein
MAAPEIIWAQFTIFWRPPEGLNFPGQKLHLQKDRQFLKVTMRAVVPVQPTDYRSIGAAQENALNDGFTGGSDLLDEILIEAGAFYACASAVRLRYRLTQLQRPVEFI